LEDLTKKLSLDTVIYIETSTYEALKHYKPKFFKKFFKGYKSVVEVLEGNRLKFMKHTSKKQHRFVVLGTPFVAYTIPKAATLEARGTSLQSQNALLKVLVSLGMADKDEAEKILLRNESFFNFMDWSSEDGDAGEGTVQLALNLHLPPGMCRGNKMPGFGSLQRLLPLPFRTLLLFRLMMGPLMLNLLLDSRGGKKVQEISCVSLEKITPLWDMIHELKNSPITNLQIRFEIIQTDFVPCNIIQHLSRQARSAPYLFIILVCSIIISLIHSLITSIRIKIP